MGHRAEVVLRAGEVHLAHGVWAALAEHAASLDALVAGSDAARLRSGRATSGLGPLFLQAAATAVAAARATNGAYDPTRRRGRPAGAHLQVAIDVQAGTLWLPPGVTLDLGPVAAAFVVDSAATWLRARTASALVLVDDCVAAVGASPRGGWRIDRPGAARQLRLRAGAVALGAGAEPNGRAGEAVAYARTAVEAVVARATGGHGARRRRVRLAGLI